MWSTIDFTSGTAPFNSVQVKLPLQYQELVQGYGGAAPDRDIFK